MITKARPGLLASAAVIEPTVPASTRLAADPRPLVGYAMIWTAAILFGVNGSVSKVILDSGLSPLRLAQVRTTGALVGLAVLVLVLARHTLRVGARDLPFLIAFGVAGLAFVQLFYFLAIERLPVGVALLIEYLAPLLIALWARLVIREAVRRRIWAALALAIAGLALVVQVWNGLAFDGLGVAAALIDAVALAIYVLLAERGVAKRDPLSLSFFAFLFAALFWAVVQPLWTFPVDAITRDVSLLGNFAGTDLPVWSLIGWVILLGTIAPFGLVVAALRHLPATTVAIVAMLEPVAAAIVAFLWLDESLAAIQLAGGGVVLLGILLAQTAR